MIHAATVSIVHDDSFLAGRDAVDELVEELGDQPHLVIMFASAHYEQEKLLAGVWSRLDASVKLAGCSSYAEINSREALNKSVTMMGMRLTGLDVQTYGRVFHGESRDFGRSLASEAKEFGATLLMVFPDGMRVNGTQFLLGLQDVLGAQFPIIGGVAADTGDFTKTWEYHGRDVLVGGASVVAFKGPIKLVTAARSGWMAVGATRKATKVEGGNVLLEIDSRPALDLYKEYLGNRVGEMPTVSIDFPVGVVDGLPGKERAPGDEILLLRALKGVDEKRRAIIFGGDIPQDAFIRMTRATKEDVIDGANNAGNEVHQAMTDPSIALVFNCMARKVVLGPRYKQELEATFAKLGSKIPKIGFYTLGELSPVQGTTMHHDETFTIALLKA